MSAEMFSVGSLTVRVVANEAEMGMQTAELVQRELHESVARGQKPVLWIMAAPSAFPFYRAFVEQCRSNPETAAIVKNLAIYQFDDYPIGRADHRFPVTFRALLEEYFLQPLRGACGPLSGVRLLELTGTDRDPGIADTYYKEISSLLDQDNARVIQVKGTGMDGHWGFHGAETPLDTLRSWIEVEMGPQNVRQQRIDWPQYFQSDRDVPSTAYSATVPLFMKSDFVVDNVPQVTKQFSVLACYGTNEVTGEVPSSALKRHPHSVSLVTAAAAGALVEFQAAQERGERFLPAATLDRLLGLWDDPEDPESAEKNRWLMKRTLARLGIVPEG